MKVNSAQFFFCSAAILALSGCMIPSPQMIKQAMAMSSPLGMESGGIHGTDAEEFSKKLVTLKVGRATKEECIATLGKPAMNSEISLHYTLKNTGNAGPVSAQLYFKHGILSKAYVAKISMSGGSVDVNNVYSQGNAAVQF